MSDTYDVQEKIESWLKENGEEFAWHKFFGYLNPNPRYLGLACSLTVTIYFRNHLKVGIYVIEG